ncbi:MAG: flavodoxin family protein [Clostridia bacterium]
MKILAINGSPNARGNTRAALDIVAEQLASEGIECEIHQVGHKVIHGCMACGLCARNKDERCAQADDGVNELIQLMKSADGILLGSPVHFASIGGTMKSFLDRVFYVSGANGNLLRHKVGAGLVAVRRTGGMTAFGQLNHYLMYAEMLVPTSNYWNVIHGAKPGEAVQDLEGVQLMRVLGKNMAWLLKLRANGLAEVGSGMGGTEARLAVVAPEKEAKVRMSFIR